MVYKALYREWRPKTFEDLVGQEHITTTLKNQIENERIAHAYLFCGTRGTGKTSTAKIMAKALNCPNSVHGEPCNQCEMCKKIDSGLAIDVTELDAASNNKVDNIRDLIDDTKYPPQESKYKVYILDEVHMLSMGAVNAFLKTLEEPPERVVFILATTDPQKLPITILSRCQRFDFRRIDNKVISKRLRHIVDVKGILADNKSIDLISRTSDGAMRDALSILDQAIAMGDGKIEYGDVVAMLGLITNDHLLKLTSAIIERNVEEGMNIIEDIVLSGKDIYLFIKDLIHHFRNLLMSKVTTNPEEVLDMSFENIELIKEQSQRIRTEEIMRDVRILQEAESTAKLSKESRLYLELAVIKMCKIQYDTSSEVILARINKLEEGLRSGSISLGKAQKADLAASKDKIEGKTNIDTHSSVSEVHAISNNTDIEEMPKQDNIHSKITLEDVKKKWKDILEVCKSRRQMIIYASLLTGVPINCTKGIITIQFEEDYSQSKERLENSKNIQIVNEIISEGLGEPIRCKFVINSKSNTGNTHIGIEEVLKNSGVEITHK